MKYNLLITTRFITIFKVMIISLISKLEYMHLSLEFLANLNIIYS